MERDVGLGGLQRRSVGEAEREPVEPAALVVGLVGVDRRDLRVVEVQHVDARRGTRPALQRRGHGAVGRDVGGVDHLEIMQARGRDHDGRVGPVGPQLARDAGQGAIGSVREHPPRTRLRRGWPEPERPRRRGERVAARPRQVGVVLGGQDTGERARSRR